MKKLTLVLLTLVLFTRCNHENLLTAELTRSPFYCTKISWDTNDMLTYGSGEIIYFDKKGNLKIFSNSFLKNKDSLTWGEPGIILKEGRWIIDKDLIICIYRTLYRTFKVTPEVGVVRDTIYFTNNGLRRSNMILDSKLIISKEIINFIHEDWTKLK